VKRLGNCIFYLDSYKNAPYSPRLR
jgi:hypothetical protein